MKRNDFIYGVDGDGACFHSIACTNNGKPNQVKKHQKTEKNKRKIGKTPHCVNWLEQNLDTIVPNWDF